MQKQTRNIIIRNTRKLQLPVLQNKSKVLLRACKLIIPFNSFTVLPRSINWLLWSNRILNARKCFRAPEIKWKIINYSCHTRLPLLGHYFVTLHTEYDTLVTHLCLCLVTPCMTLVKKNYQRLQYHFYLSSQSFEQMPNFCHPSSFHLSLPQKISINFILSSSSLSSFLIYPSNLWLIRLHFLLPWPITFPSQTITSEELRK